MMDSQRKKLIVFLSILAYCKLTEATGLCKFASMFPSQHKNNCITSGNVAKVRDHKDSTTRYETSETTSTKHPTAQIALTSEAITNQSKNEMSTTDRSKKFQLTTKSTANQPNHDQSTYEPPTTEKLTELTTKQLASTPPTSPPCAPNMVLGPSCDCERTCQDPISCDCTGPETCVCPDGFVMNNGECIHEEECGCYYDGARRVIPDGATHVKEDCSERCTCGDNVLNCDSTYPCSLHATCIVEDGVQQCYCNDGYVGDGETCKKLYTDCYDAYQAGHSQDGNFTILPQGWSGSPFNVSCDMTTNGGGWTIIQRRLVSGVFGGSKWQEYKDGFGSNSDTHWLGNEKIFYLTNQRNYTLQIDLVSFRNGISYQAYQEYSLFKIADKSDNYRLIDLGKSSGTAGDGMVDSLGRQFSTNDRDNDGCDDIDCSKEHGYGGWWYSNECCDECCNSDESTCFYHELSDCKRRCTKANLNSLFISTYVYKRIFWNDMHDIISTEMKIRPAN